MHTSAPAIQLLFSVALAALLIWPAQDHIFFWDTVQLGAKHAWWYYDTDFSNFLLPDDLDSGHPPFFGMMLAAVWKLTGNPNLPASHWMMLPFLAGIIYQLCSLIRKFTPHSTRSLSLLFLFLADPVLLGQSILISPDLPLLFCFLLGVNAIEGRKKGWLVIAVIGLAMVSMRGMMTAAGLYLYAVFSGWDSPENGWRRVLRTAVPFIPGGVIAVGFLAYHYQIKGWIGYHADSPWAPSFQPANLRGLLKNIAIAGWRWLDFGRVFLWLGLAVLMMRSGLKTFRIPMVKKAFTLFICITFALSISLLAYSGLQAHRYLLPAFVAFTLFVLVAFIHAETGKKWKTVLLLAVFLGLATGNRWIYPDKVSQGWDATLAHWPYYGLRDEMLGRIRREGIPLNHIGTAFPEIGPLKYRDLSANMDGMVEKDLQNQHWILYSNVMNDFSDDELGVLEKDWRIKHYLERNGVKFVLYFR